MVESGDLYNKLPKLESVPKDLIMDYSRILNKPFFIDNYIWNTNQGVNVSIATPSFPSVMLNNNLIKVPFKSANLYRMRMCATLQVSGTPMHQGILLVAALPPDVYVVHPTQLLQAPHAFLVANESTPVCIEIPFYPRTVLPRTAQSQETSLSKFDYATLHFLVINPLVAAGTASTQLTVSMHGMIKEAEFYVPKSSDRTWTPVTFSAETFTESLFRIPTNIFDGLASGAKKVTGDFIDSMRLGLRELTGFHNPNSPAINDRMIYTDRNFGNNVDQPNLFEKLDQHAQFDRIVQDNKFSTDQDEMDLQFILKKPCLIGNFEVRSIDLAGTVKAAMPISPMVEGKQTTSPVSFFAPLRIFYENSRYWRGSLKLHIQASMSNFHFCKLLVVKDYSGDSRLLTQHPSWLDAHNLMTDTLEFSAGGQIQTIDLPYCSELEQLECTKDLALNAVQHGMVYIYLLQPLTTNGTVSLSVNFNMYMSVGDDFQFYGYGVDTLPIKVGFTPVQTGNESTEEGESTFIAESNEVTVGVSEQTDLINEETSGKVSNLRMEDFKPMVNVRDYVRRLVHFTTASLNTDAANKCVSVFNISRLMAKSQSSTQAIRSMFFGFSGGIKTKLVIRGLSTATVYYVPPGSYYNNLQPQMSIANVEYTRNKLDLAKPTVDRTKFSMMFQELPTSRVFPNVVPEQTVLEFEFVIPNMNPYRFIRNPLTASLSPEDNMGEIIIVAPNPSSTAYMDFYAGFTDETRFGFQVYTPRVYVPEDTDPLSRATVFGPVLACSTVYGAAYYYTKLVVPN